MVKRLIDGIYRGLQFLITLLIGLLLVPVVLQIVSRFTEIIPRYIWTEEVARLCFIWVIMPAPKTARGRALARMIRHGMMLLVAFTFVYFGYDFALFGYNQESELTG